MPFKTNVLASYCCIVLFLLLSSSLLAQKTVTGRVISNADKQPIVGATVQIKGTKVATQTGADGSFSISSQKDVGTLVITVVGFEALQIPVAGRASIGDVVLSLSATSLNDVVVTGYTAQRKKDITGAVSVVSVKDMKTIPVASPEQMLQGQASGVNVVTSGQPGAPSNIFIRGVSSFGNTAPLVIIDGVQASLRDINANDIESMQILKDAGAASIYGVRGSNGVIVVTTKRGRPGKATISYDGYIGTQQPPSGNVYNLLNSQELANALWIADKNAGQVAANGNPSSVQYGNGASPVLPDYITPGGAHEGDSSVNPALYNTDYNKGNIYQITKANKGGTDWFHEIFKPALIQSHTVTASGGGEKSSYLFSVGYFDQQGSAIYTYLKRYNARINTTFNIKNNVRIGENAYVVYKQNPGLNLDINGENIINLIYRTQPIIPVYDLKGNWAGSNGPELGNAGNPVADQTRGKDNITQNWDVIGNVWGEVDFLKHFTVRTQFGGTIDNGFYNGYTYHTYENAENNSGNSYAENHFYNSTWDWVNTLTYNNTFAEKHNLKVLVGSEAISYTGRVVGGQRLNYFSDDPALRVINAGSPTNQQLWGYSAGQTGTGPYMPGPSTLYSLFGRLDYSFMDKYYLGFTLRRDAASQFGPDHQVGYFPSYSGGWVVSNEEFMKNVTWLNFLKIRGSWGKLGSKNNVSAANQYNLYNSAGGSSYYDIQGTSSSIVQGFYASQIGNPKTGWEEDVLWNIGFDAALIKNKVELSVEYYKKKINGLLFGDVVGSTVGGSPTLGGASLPQVNIGDVQNTGVDATVTYHAQINRDLKINVALNITTYKTQIVSIPGTTGYFDAADSRIGNLVRNQQGHPISAFYGYKITGFFNESKDTAGWNQADKGLGRFKFADVNGDGQVDDADRTFIGNPNPKFIYGINLGATWKDLDFSMILYGSQGNDVFNYTRYWTDFWASFQGNKSKDLLYNSWTPEHHNAKAPILENVQTKSTNGYVTSYYIENGSYLRCKSLMIGYTVPVQSLKKVGIDKLRIYLQAANLFTITKYTGPDPELPGGLETGGPNQGNPSSASYGIDYGNYPVLRTYIVGVNLTF